MTPLPIDCVLEPGVGTLLSDITAYRAVVGKLNFLTHTRPDLNFAVQKLSQFLSAPTNVHWRALLHVLRYVKGNIGLGIHLHADSVLKVRAFCDSDWAACSFSRRSITGYAVLLGSSPISWRSKKQSTISRSSSEAE